MGVRGVVGWGGVVGVVRRGEGGAGGMGLGDGGYGDGGVRLRLACFYDATVFGDCVCEWLVCTTLRSFVIAFAIGLFERCYCNW